MGRNKLYDKRIHFWGPAALDDRARSLVEKRTAEGVRTTLADVLRDALSVGLDGLETGARYAHGTAVHGAATPYGLEPDDVRAAAEVLEELVELGDALRSVDLDVIKALGELDVDVLKSLGRLDAENLDSLAFLDMQPLVALGDLDIKDVVRLADALSERALAP